MKSFEVSLLNWNPGSGLAATLKTILHSCRGRINSSSPFQFIPVGFFLLPFARIGPKNPALSIAPQLNIDGKDPA